jgi:hypothetical protein
MKLTIQPVRQMQKGRVKVWVDCDASKAQAYELRNSAGKCLRRERQLSTAQRIARLFAKPAPAPDRRKLVGKRWSDVKDKL